MKEEWKDVVGFEGYYKVSNLGNVISLRRKFMRTEHLMSPAVTPYGYAVVCLRKPDIKTTVKVHRLVAQAFIPNPDNLPQVNHKDEDKLNNCVDNLEWCDSKYNINYGTVVQRRIETIARNGGRVQSEETRQRIREKAIGRKHSDEIKRKMSEDRKGKKHWWSINKKNKTECSKPLF